MEVTISYQAIENINGLAISNLLDELVPDSAPHGINH